MSEIVGMMRKAPSESVAAVQTTQGGFEGHMASEGYLSNHHERRNAVGIGSSGPTVYREMINYVGNSAGNGSQEFINWIADSAGNGVCYRYVWLHPIQLRVADV